MERTIVIAVLVLAACETPSGPVPICYEPSLPAECSERGYAAVCVGGWEEDGTPIPGSRFAVCDGEGSPTCNGEGSPHCQRNPRFWPDGGLTDAGF